MPTHLKVNEIGILISQRNKLSEENEMWTTNEI